MTLSSLVYCVKCLDIGIKFKTSSCLLSLANSKSINGLKNGARHAMKGIAKKKRPKGYLSPKIWKSLRTEVFSMYGRKCMKCWCEESEMHVDHIKPKSLYPHLKYDVENLQVLCKSCNFSKGFLDETDYRSE